MPSDLANMISLQETQHESFRLPADKDIRIWRYMDIAKYLSMLDQQSLFFPRATLLGDPFEGSIPKPMVDDRERIRANKTLDPSIAAALLNWGDTIKQMIQNYFISCWHINDHESAAMWKLYSSANEAVCIQSTYRRLRLGLPECIRIGEVNYIDYGTQRFPDRYTELTPLALSGFDTVMHKRVSFAHERELRAIFWDLEETPGVAPYKTQIEPSGLAIKVNMTHLIEHVYISPTAAPWFKSLVASISGKYGFTFPVKQSSLAAAPLY